MSLFYLAPIAVTAWFVGRTPAAALAVTAAALWFASDISARGSDMLVISSWNGFTRLIIYLSSALLLALLRRDRDQLRKILLSAEQSARTDPLTGLANSRAFYERLREEIPRLQRSDTAVAVVYLDIDNFKRINDRHGHSTGDDVLKEIAHELRGTTRAGDLVARLGGDEFAIALWDTVLPDAREMARRIVHAVDRVSLSYPGTGLGASIGIAMLEGHSSIDDAIRAADAAMYETKAARKRVPAIA